MRIFPAVLKRFRKVSAICRMSFAACVIIAVYAADLYAQVRTQVGYATLTSDAGSRVPVGSALFGYTNGGGVLVSEAGVAASEPIRAGRIFVDETETQTGLALVNPSSQDASISLTLRDEAGREVSRKLQPLQAHQHLAQYVSQLFPDRPAQFRGSLTFESNQALAAVTLRESRNAYGEPLYSTLPVVDLASPPSNEAVVFPHIAAGAGYTTELLLINRTSQIMRGRINLAGSNGVPLIARLAGSAVTDFAYEIQPDGTYRADLDSETGLAVGYATATPAAGSTAPAGTAVFQSKSGSSLVTEAGVAATPATTSARIFVDYAGTQTGVALANPGEVPADLSITLMDRFGVPEVTIQQRLPARNHMSKFVHELFPSVTNGYTGLMEIRSTSPIVPITLKLTTNTRNDLVLTTLPVADLAHLPSVESLVFPHIALGGGFTTRLILINPDIASAAAGRLTFYQPDGTAMVLPVAGQTAFQFAYQILPGAGRLVYPGNSASIAGIVLVDPSSNQISSEVVINEGNSVRPSLQVIDTTGAVRNDIDATIRSLDTSVAGVDATGRIQGKKAGFSTLTITAGGVLKTATAVVVKVDAGVDGFETVGVVQDLARRLYLASAADQLVLRAEDLKRTPEIYAGVRGATGLKNDLRPASLFNGPSFLALNQAEGSLYVSDSANHVIRLVRPGPAGRVDTLAGSGVAGSRDGNIREAAFNNPQGVVLDARGNLWVADSGNHTIRRINLSSGVVETIAGQAGSPGAADGRGAAVRFNTPTGLAAETETASQTLERQRRGLPPPPVSILVADGGNGMIRRVKETGEVETIRSSQTPLTFLSQGGTTTPAAAGVVQAATFLSPAGIAVDSAGNIYVAEAEKGRVRSILRTGEIVSAVQAGTVTAPQGVAVGQDGKVLVAGKDRAARELLYGQPQITAISPNQVRNTGGQKITIKGSNFAPDTLVVIAGTVINDPLISDTQTVTFTLPALPSGRSTVTFMNRGGSAQTSLLVTSASLNDLRPGYITTVAGGSTYAGEGAGATASPIGPGGVAVDANGNVFITDSLNRKVRRVSTRTGIMTTVAGNGQDAVSGDNGPAVAAGISANIHDVAFDRAGNLLIVGGGVRRVDAASGTITTIVGRGYGFCGDGGNALDACFDYITAIAVDGDGNIYLSDRYNNRVRRVDAKTNIITTLAGNGQAGFSGDNGDARAASLNEPFGLAVDTARNALYISDWGNTRVRKVDLTTNVITSIAGGGTPGAGIGDGGPATAASVYANAVALDSAGNLFISDRGHSRIRKVDITTGIITTIAGSDAPGDTGSYGDGGLATSASLSDPSAVVVDAAGNVLISDYYRYVVRKVDALSQVITTLAGTGKGVVLDDGGPATAATLRIPTGVAVDAVGNLFITDTGNDRIRKVNAATGIIETFAGGGTPADGLGDGLLATNAGLTAHGRVRLDESGNFYVADRYNYRVRKINSNKIITTIAGTGEPESSGDGGLATRAGVLPDDIAVDSHGNLYIAEGDNPEGMHRIRKVNLANGTITTVAGPASGLSPYLRIAVDGAGNLFIADAGNGKIRRIDAVTQTMTTIAGGGASYADNQRATAVSLLPASVDVDAEGNLIVLDYAYPISVRKIAVQTGIITTIAAFAGDTVASGLGDNGPMNMASVGYPSDAIVDTQGNLFIADTDDQRIRAVRGPLN